MATRSTIAIEREDGSVAQVYCHWDGYLENNGYLLEKFWSDADKLEKLIAHGDLSSLGEEIGERHEFSNPHPFPSAEFNEWAEAHRKMCTFYSRDRDEDDVFAREYESFGEYQYSAQMEEYNYILTMEGEWLVLCYETHNKFKPMDKFLTKAMVS